MELAGDLLEGAQAIASEVGLPTRRIFRLLEQKAIPAFKMGGKWYARRSSLRAHIERLERGEAVA